MGAATIVLGDLRHVADGVALSGRTNQKLSQWPHNKLRRYVTYKAKAVGIATVLVDEHHTTKTCPACGHEHKPKGRAYCCPACGLRAHRDVVGAANILSRHRCGELAKIKPPTHVTYRIPFNRRVMRSRPDTAQVA
jgi:putative transposase